jgi:hypothetical protein
MVNVTESNGLLAAGSVILSPLPCLLTGFLLITDGTNPVTITLYDSEDNSGEVLSKYVVPGAVGGIVVMFPVPVRAKIALYAVLSGTNGGAVVYSTPE